MESNIINSLTNNKNLSMSTTSLKPMKIKFNKTIDIPNDFKTHKNVNKNIKSLSILTTRKNKINKTICNNNIESMNKILGKLINLKTKLNQIKIKKKRSTKLLKLKKLKPKIMCKTESKNKYLLFMNDYYKNKLLLKKRKQNLENALSEEERNDNYNRFLNPAFINFEKTDINNNESSKQTKLSELITIENDDEIRNKENNSSYKFNSRKNSKFSFRKSLFANNLEIEKKESNKHLINFDDIIIPKIIPEKKESNKHLINCDDKIIPKLISEKKEKEKIIKDYNDKKSKKSNNSNNISNSFIIIQDHINYIKRIRENELLDLINRYKKSMQRNELEEMSHIQRFVFPTDLISYLIKMKKELTVEKFRTEYFNKLERYNLNNILHLKNLKNKAIVPNKN